MIKHSAIEQLIGEIAFDPDQLGQKYMSERDKRIRDDRNEQFIAPTGSFRSFARDPYVGEPTKRETLTDLVDVAIVGAGFGALLMGARLRDLGVERIRLVDRAADVGGTWYWNRYPGAMCDVESLIYLPLLEELGYTPEHRYSYAPEILEHARSIARKWDLYRDACFETSVIDVVWSEAESVWHVHTEQGDDFRARYVVLSTGPLSRPKLPGIPGITDFEGTMFHTSRWNYDYTGGGPAGGLEGLADKRVGIVGTGATAVQCVPHLAEHAKELYVFQRTPVSVDVRNQSRLEPGWVESQDAGWQQHRMDNFNILVSGGDTDEDLVNDSWTDIYRKLTGLSARRASEELGRRLTPGEKDELLELLDYEKMEQIRGRILATLHDADTAEYLLPWYRQFCKRPCFHDDYLPAFNRPNVHLVDTNGQGVEQVLPSAVVVEGNMYDLDCLIFATGFEVGTAYTRVAGFEVEGTAGLKLSTKWGLGVRTLHGVQSRGFPNCFFLGFSETARTVNIPHALNEQAKHVAYMIDQARQHGYGVIEPTVDGEAAWGAEMLRTSGRFDALYSECTPSYFNSEGDINNPHGFYATTYGGGPVAFFAMLEAWRASGDLVGTEIR